MVENHSTPGSRRHLFITGASTGIGRATAAHLASLGFHVFAGVRRDEDAKLLEKFGTETAKNGGGICGILTDVTQPDSIATAISKISEIVGDDGLLGLINNAGVSFSGPVEFVPLNDWRQQFEINVFGQIAVIQATLPLLRTHVAKHGKGSARLINMSSIAGKIAQPIVGPYVSSKFALEAISDSLRLELRPQGIHVCLVNPGAIDTPIWSKGQEAEKTIQRGQTCQQLYGPLIENVKTAAAQAATNARPALTVAKAVEICLLKRKPPIRTFVGMDAKSGAISKRLMPDSWFDAALIRYFKVPD